MEMTQLSNTSLLYWALGLSVCFPLLMVALGELTLRAERAGWQTAKTLAGLRFIVIPSLALILFLRFVVGWTADNTVYQLVKTVFWIAVLYQSLSFLNQVVFGDATAGSWQSRVPSLVRDLLRFALVGIGAALIYSEVWGKEIGAAWAALGLGSVVIGLALQEPLGNTVSGLILLAERPLDIGDWVTVDGVTGKVVEINWRSVRVQTPALELKIVPNSALYRGSFSNLSRPTQARADSLELTFASALPPNRVKRVLLDLIRSIPEIIDIPAPSVSTVNSGGDAVTYQLGFAVARQEDLGKAKDKILTRLWYVAKRAGLHHPGAALLNVSEHKPFELLRDFPVFEVPHSLVSEIDDGIRFLSYGADESVVNEGKPLLGLYFVVQGLVELSAKDLQGATHVIGQVDRGDFFGENAMVAGQLSEFTALAVEDTDLIVIDPHALQKLLDHSPRLVRQVGHMLESRRTAIASIRGRKLSIIQA